MNCTSKLLKDVFGLGMFYRISVLTKTVSCHSLESKGKIRLRYIEMVTVELYSAVTVSFFEHYIFML